MQILPRYATPTSLSPQALVTILMRERGLLDPSLSSAPSPTPLPTLADILRSLHLPQASLEKAVRLIHEAIAQALPICIYGDYDADGITATAVLWLTLKKMGANVLPYIPHRLHNGYGLTEASVTSILDGTGFPSSPTPFVPQLLITVDNGIVAHNPIARLKQAGVKVILTDHHQPQSSLPPADVVIHTLATSGAGIAWVLASYLQGEANLATLDLATIGIVTDQIPLLGLNRHLVRTGLDALSRTTNLGLRQIVARSGRQGRALTTNDINFAVGPRLNAVGRLGDATDALRLLCTTSPADAQRLVELMETQNLARQQLTQEALQLALRAPTSSGLVVVASDTFHHGVIGLIASKLVEVSARPAIVMSLTGDIVKGSARSIPHFNITEVLREHSDLLLSIGGHEQAAGFSLLPNHLAELTRRLNSYPIPTSLQAQAETLNVDLALPLSALNLDYAQALLALEPYGAGNPKPIFWDTDLEVLADRPLGDAQQHHRLTLYKDGQTRTVMWFNGQSVAGKITDLVYSIGINRWQGRDSLELIATYVR